MNEDWYESAACAGEDPELFFPKHHGREGSLAYAHARRICASCPVSEQCLADAATFESLGHRWGMRGGMSPSERDKRPRKVRTLRCVICDSTVSVEPSSRAPRVIACSDEHYRQYRRAQQYASMGRTA